MSESDPFRGAFDRPEQLREFYDSPMEAAIRKDIGKLDELCRRLIAAAPMLFVATFSPEGQADVSPAVASPASSRCWTNSTSRSRTPRATGDSTRSRTSSRAAA